MSIAVASGLGAKYGILVKNGDVLETLSTINHVIFDKTGTLTEGGMSVVGIYTDRATWNVSQATPPATLLVELMQKVFAVERYSEHPTAHAVTSWHEKFSSDKSRLEGKDFSYTPGLGVSGVVENQHLLAGTSLMMSNHEVVLSDQLEQTARHLAEQGIGSFYIAIDGRHVGLIAVEDRIRPDARELITALKAEGLKLTLLSGDRWQTAEAIAQRLGGLEVIAEVLPEEKDQVVQRLQGQGMRVAMVGDGVNDAPALVRADVGIAMGSGTDVSIASADIVLMSSELERVRLAIGLSRRTLLTIRQNIGISIVYNIIMVPLAMAAIVTPLVAAISMPLSSLAVIGNSARIRTLFKGVKAQQ
jgi:Cu2+-exporting ATPase